MAKISNNFLSAIINKDDDERIIPSDRLVDAENFIVMTTEGNNRGVGKNVPGNRKLTTNNFTTPEVLGSCPNKLNNNIYYFIKTPTFDYIFELNLLTGANVVVLQSTINTRLNFQTGRRITNINIIYSGEEYDPVTRQGGNLIAWSGDDNPPRIGNIERMKTWGIDGFTAEEIMLIKAPPLTNPIVLMLTTSSPEGQAENYLKDKFISFAYRFKYKDGYYSAISSWEQYSFSPKPFKLNFVTMENEGMVNLYNACNISFNSGPREVIAVDLLFKKSNESIVYKIDQFIKAEEGWADNALVGPIQFNNSKVYQILPENQYFRSFDNVPEEADAQTLIGSRIAFANYRENKNLTHNKGIIYDNGKTVMNYTVGYVSIKNEENEIPRTKLTTNPQLIVPGPTVPFTTSSIANGKIRLDFTGVALKENSAISVFFNIKTLPVSPPLTPTRNETHFINPYLFILTQDYPDIQTLVNDTVNGFKTNLETAGYFSDLIKNSLTPPVSGANNGLPFPTSYFHGFIVSIVSANIIEISFPVMKWEIEVLPSGPNTYVEEFFTDVTTQTIVNNVGSKKSMKSFRSYDIAIIYRDAFGRKTTALTSEFSTVFIPIKNSINQNKITVTIPSTQKPPYWATSYKFAIKENKGFYDTIYCTTFYVDGQFVWIKLQGTSINKVKVNDTLLVKRDINDYVGIPITVKVLEIKNQEQDFITGNVDKNGQQISEEEGLYMKIKPEGVEIKYIGDEFRIFYFDDSSHETPRSEIIFKLEDGTTDMPFPAGSVVTFEIHSSYRSDQESNSYNQSFVASSDYANFGAFYDAQLATVAFQGPNTGVDNGGVYPKEKIGVNGIRIFATSHGTGRYHAFLSGKILVRTLSGMVIFETIPKDIDTGIFYETPDIFPIINGEHVINNLDLAEERNVVNGIHTLEKTFNCFVQGNGAESNQILDAFNEKYVSIDFSPTAVSENEYRQINRFADITYSEPYNTNTSINKLNEFNLSLANFKDDIEKSFGPIIKLAGLDTNLEVFQEDKDSIVYYGKDLLYNADGTTNLTGIAQVLGEQKTYEGEYGISTHPESYARYGYDTYHTDVKRGVVIKKSNNGLFEISSQGMTNYFKKLFRDTIINSINAEYDQYNQLYVLNIKYTENSVQKYVTWFYSDRFNGWTTRMTFNPQDMCALNSNLISFDSGEAYLHNQKKDGISDNYNTFYGVIYPSTFEFYFSQFPSDRKQFKTLDIEGTIPLTIATKTDLTEGYINSADFEKKEGFFYAYIRNSNVGIDTKLLSSQGIGNATITGLGLTLSFDFPVDPIVSIGDKIFNANSFLVGTIFSRTDNSLTLDTVNSLVSGDYVFCAKSQSIQANTMLGYYMNVKASFGSINPHEIFALNSEVFKSSP